MSVVQTLTTVTLMLHVSTLKGVSCAHVLKDIVEMELLVKVKATSQDPPLWWRFVFLIPPTQGANCQGA